MGLIRLRGREHPGISGIELGVSHLFRLLLVPEDILGRSFGQVGSAGDKLSFNEIGIAEKAKIIVVDHGITVNILVARIKLIAKDSKLYMRSLLLGEGQYLSNNCAHINNPPGMG